MLRTVNVSDASCKAMFFSCMNMTSVTDFVKEGCGTVITFAHVLVHGMLLQTRVSGPPPQLLLFGWFCLVVV